MRIILIIGIIAIAGCTSRQETQLSNNDTSHQTKREALISELLVNTDKVVSKTDSQESFDSCYWFKLDKKVTALGNYIAYERFDDYNKYQISWGNKNFKRSLPDTFYCEAPLGTLPQFEEENKNYVVTKFWCGTSCWGSIYLPLNATQPVRRIYYDYVNDLDHDLVASLGLEETKSFIAIHNLKTSNEIRFKMEVPCESAIPTYCLDSISITGKYLYYRWITDWKTKKAIERTVKIR